MVMDAYTAKFRAAASLKLSDGLISLIFAYVASYVSANSLIIS